MMNTNKTLLGTVIFSLFIHLGALFYSLSGLQTTCGRKKEEKLIVSFGTIEPPAFLAQEPTTKKEEIVDPQEISTQRYKLEESIEEIPPKLQNESILEEQGPPDEQVEGIKSQDDKDILITKTLPEEKVEDGYRLAKCDTDSQSGSFPSERENPGVPALTGGQIEDIKTKFLKEVEANIQKAKIYPRSARINGIEGTARVEFSLSGKGELLSVKLKGSSGHNILDETAIHILKRASPFPPIPKELKVSNIELFAPIVFKLEGRLSDK